MPKRKCESAVVLVTLLVAGCAADQMKFTALRTAARIPEIQQQEIMQNLARIAENPGAMPYLSRPYNGTASATDTASGVASLTGQPHHYTSVNYGLSGLMRAVQSNIGLNVVDDPDKLAAMHVAYRLVTAPQTVSPDMIHTCLDRFRSGHNPCVEGIPQGCWLHVGSKGDVPHGAAASAHSGSTYVWVMPEDLESLTGFTYFILNIATLKSDRMAAVPSAAPGAYGAAPAPAREENPVFNPNLLLIPRP